MPVHHHIAQHKQQSTLVFQDFPYYIEIGVQHDNIWSTAPLDVDHLIQVMTQPEAPHGGAHIAAFFAPVPFGPACLNADIPPSDLTHVIESHIIRAAVEFCHVLSQE